jgi:hypothetical protein
MFSNAKSHLWTQLMDEAGIDIEISKYSEWEWENNPSRAPEPRPLSYVADGIGKGISGSQGNEAF